MEILLAIATLVGGGAAIWFFWDKIVSWWRGPSTSDGAGGSAALDDLIHELEHNARVLNDRSFATAPSLRDEAWVAARGLARIDEALRASLNTIYAEIRSAKAVHDTIIATNSPNTMPEQLRLEGHLDAAMAEVPGALTGLRALR